MAYNRQNFYKLIRKHVVKSLSQDQVDSLNAILYQLEKQKVSSEHAAYILSTAYHESRLTPVRETFAHSDSQAIARLNKAYSRKVGTKRCYWCRDKQGKSWYGRGFVQLTWRENYRKMSGILDIDLVADPDKALVPEVAADILVTGMVKGLFTGKSVSDYSTHYQRRRVVNGVDKAKKFAATARDFERVLNGSYEETVVALPPIIVDDDNGDTVAQLTYKVNTQQKDGKLLLSISIDQGEQKQFFSDVMDHAKETRDNVSRLYSDEIPTKHALQSKTIWGVIAGFVTIAAPTMFSLIGYDIDKETSAAFGQHGVAVVQLLLGVFSGVLTVTGRQTAKTGIHWVPGRTQ